MSLGAGRQWSEQERGKSWGNCQAQSFPQDPGRGRESGRGQPHPLCGRSCQWPSKSTHLLIHPPTSDQPVVARKELGELFRVHAFIVNVIQVDAIFHGRKPSGVTSLEYSSQGIPKPSPVWNTGSQIKVDTETFFLRRGP